MINIGIYPGTFDPIHAGHIAFAREALRQNNLHQVVFLPEPKPRTKLNVSPIEMRCALIQSTVATYDQLDLLQLSSDTFSTENSLDEILEHFHYPQLSLLIGSDVAKTLPSWSDLDRLLEACNLVVGLRGNDTQEQITKTLEGLSIRSVSFVSTPMRNVSSAQLREMK